MARRPPSTRARPRCGVISPASTLSSVVLPAPFGPKIGNVWPAYTRKETSSRARTAPKPCPSRSASSIDRRAELAQIVRFDEIAAVTQVQHVHERLHADVRRRDDDGERGPSLANALEQLDAVGVGQPRSEEHTSEL